MIPAKIINIMKLTIFLFCFFAGSFYGTATVASGDYRIITIASIAFSLFAVGFGASLRREYKNIFARHIFGLLFTASVFFVIYNLYRLFVVWLI